MGKLTYDSTLVVDFDDRVLAHLQIVIAAKLRRGESFMFTWDVEESDIATQASVWLHPAIPLQFEVEVVAESAISRPWLEQLSRSSNSPGGLRVVVEPDAKPDEKPDAKPDAKAAPKSDAKPDTKSAAKPAAEKKAPSTATSKAKS